MKNHANTFSIENLFFVICVLFSSNAISFYQSPISYAILLFLSVLVLIKNNIRINKSLGSACLVWLVYCIIICVTYKEFKLTFNHFIRFFVLIITSYTLINCFGKQFFYKYEKTITILAGISLFFWLWMLFDKNSILQFARAFHIGTSANDPDRLSEFFYLIVYTVEVFNNDVSILPRNFGFCMEPVVFACFLVFAIYINVLRLGCITIKNNKGLILLLLALITTLSTTGYCAFLIFVIYWLISAKPSIKTISLCIVITIVSIVLFFKIDFLFPKMESLYFASQDFDSMFAASYAGSTVSAGRFGGLIIGWKDLLKYPLGIGNNFMRSFGYSQYLGVSIYNTNGFGILMSVFGVFGVTLYLIILYKSSIFINQLFNRRSGLSLFIVFTLCMMGFPIYECVIFFTFLFYYCFSPMNSCFPPTPIRRFNKKMDYLYSRD